MSLSAHVILRSHFAASFASVALPMKRTLTALFCTLCLVVSAAAETPAPRRVAIVIDDGPVPDQSAAFVQLFREKQAAVTFSYIASVLEKAPDAGRQAVAAGCEILNHSYTHPHLTKLDAAGLDHEIGDAQRDIQGTLGRAPRFFWEPYGDTNATVAATVKKHGLELAKVPHDINTFDYDEATTGEQTFRNATTDVRDGTIIDFHEWREETLAQMPAIIDELRRQGCVLMTLSELVGALQNSKTK